MFAKPTSGSLLLKLGLVLVVLAGAAYAILTTFQTTARVKVAKRGVAVDAVTGSVSVDAEGTTNKELKAEANGKVIECEPMVEGRSFKEGDVLVQLDPTELKRTIEQTKRTYKEQKERARLLLTGGKPELLANSGELSVEDLAKLYQKVSPERKRVVEKLTQVQRMYELNNVSKEELQNAERALEDLDLNLQLKALDERKAEADFQATMDSLNLQLERMQVKAPSDGEIVEALVWKGALIGHGHVVGRFMSHDRVVAARISEEDFGKVRVGQEARVRLLTYGEQNFSGKVSKLLPKADETQRFKAFLDVQVDSPEQLKPGSTGEVTITVDKRPDSLMISRRALFDSDKVYLVKGGRVEKRTIKVGYVNLTEVQVLDGLVEGDHVIVDQLEQFREGDRVRIEVLP